MKFGSEGRAAGRSITSWHGLEDAEEEFWSEAEDWSDDVEDLLVSVVLAVTVVGKGKVFGDLWDVWLRIDVEAEENEVGLHVDEEVVGLGGRLAKKKVSKTPKSIWPVETD